MHMCRHNSIPIFSLLHVLYTEACTVVRTDAGLSGSFDVKVGLHQGSVRSSPESTVVCYCYGYCFQRGENYYTFRVAIC